MRGLGTMAAEAALAAGAALLVGLVFADGRAHACDDRVASCQPAVQAEVASDAGAPSNALATRTQHGRSIKTERSRKSRYAFADRPSRPEPRAEAAAPVTSVRPDSTAARRFREFVNPRSFALGPAIELRKPQADVGHLSAEMIDVPMILAAWTGEETVRAETMPTLAADETMSSGDPAESTPIVVQSSEKLEARQAPPIPAPKSGEMSLLRWIFVAWGGILTAASAARMVIG